MAGLPSAGEAGHGACGDARSRSDNARSGGQQAQQGQADECLGLEMALGWNRWGQGVVHEVSFLRSVKGPGCKSGSRDSVEHMAQERQPRKQAMCHSRPAKKKGLQT